MRAQRVPFRLDAEALAKAGASRVLAISAESIGATALLAAEEPTVERSGVVAVLDIVGPLAQKRITGLCGYVDGYDSIAARFGKLCADPDVSAIVLRVDSPGGDIAGLEECVRRMVEARDASGKPVFAYADEFVASAAYWLSATVASSGIYLPQAGHVGSIGVLAYVFDETKAMERSGVGVTIVRDPDGKAAGDSLGPVMDVAIERTQAIVTSACDRFVAAVGAARPSIKDARKFNGAMLSGEAAVSAGLADGVTSFEGVIALAAKAGEQIVMKKMAKAMGLGANATERDVLRGLRGLQRAAGRKMGARVVRAEDTLPEDEQPPAAEDMAPEDEQAPASEDMPTEDPTETAAEDGQLDVTCPNCGHEFSVDLPEQQREETEMAAGIRKMTGKRSAHAAVATVRAWKASHAQISAYEREAEAREESERVDLVVALVKAGEPPATAWTNAKEREPAEPWASMPIDKLRARVGALSAQPSGLASQRFSPAMNGRVNSDDSEVARKNGVSEASLAAARNEMARAANKGV